MGLGTRVERALASVTSELPGGGEARPGQTEMAVAVADAIDSSSHLLAEAGTGTGKSLAYLVPSILSGKRTVVATATKALQDQLANKDLPFLVEHLDVPFEFSVLKGRSNYVCRQRLTELEQDGQQLGFEVVEETVNADELDDIMTWVSFTHTGDRAELPFEPSGRTWGAVSVGPTECPGAARCPSGSTCFAENARAAALEAEVIVVNTHLYALDLVTDNAVLGEHDVVVIDEAHQIEDIVANAAGFDLTAGRLRNLALTIKSIIADDGLTGELIDAGEDLGLELEPHAGNRLHDADFDGDLARTLSARADDGELVGGDRTLLPIDLAIVSADEKKMVMVASLVIRRSWWRGPISAAMNASYLGDWNVAPSGHPNDGRVDVIEADLSLSDRWKARTRLASGTHVPHPDISIRRLKQASWELDGTRSVTVDGVDLGRPASVTIDVVADAVTVAI